METISNRLANKLAAAPAQPTVGADAPIRPLTITRAPGTVRRGARATVAARTTPGVQCSIVVRYKSGPSKAQGLGPKTADVKGDVSWSWMGRYPHHARQLAGHDQLRRGGGSC